MITTVLFFSGVTPVEKLMLKIGEGRDGGRERERERERGREREGGERERERERERVCTALLNFNGKYVVSHSAPFYAKKTTAYVLLIVERSSHVCLRDGSV